jgi:acetolactate synthase I/III small subunit
MHMREKKSTARQARLGDFFIQFFNKGANYLERHVLSVLVRNSSGVLTRVSGLFARRGFNIDSLTVGRTESSDISRMTIVLMGNEDVLEQFIKQLNKLEDVLRVHELKSENSVYRELVLIKVQASPEKRGAINEVVNIFRSKMIDVAHNTVTIELTGDDSKITALIELMEDYGIVEIVRTGITALERGDKDITNYGEYFN